MSIKEGVRQKLYKIQRLKEEIAACLIDDPHCLDGDSQKAEAYQIARKYFSDKMEATQNRGNDSHNWCETIKLGVLLDGYADGSAKEKQEYAKKIARYLLQTSKNWLELIPDDTKNTAFQIVTQYLEAQMH